MACVLAPADRVNPARVDCRPEVPALVPAVEVNAHGRVADGHHRRHARVRRIALVCRLQLVTNPRPTFKGTLYSEIHVQFMLMYKIWIKYL